MFKISDTGYIWDYLLSHIPNPFAVAGIMGNLRAESSLRPDNLQNSYERSFGMTDAEYTKAVDTGAYTEDQFTHDHAGYGLAQWTYSSRKRGLYRATVGKGKSIADLNGQLDFLLSEVEANKGLSRKLSEAQSVEEASTAFMLDFEKPADTSEANQKRRAELGQEIYDSYAGGDEVITAQELIATCEIPLEEKWGYIWGTSGQLWTQVDQNKATDDTIKRYGQQWVGRHVCDCSGLFYWAFGQLGNWIHHGSNSIWNCDCVDKTKGKLKDGKREDGKEVRPGSAVFLTEMRGGKESRHHIGIYIGSNMCIEAKGTRSGVVSSPLAHWDEVAELKNISYGGEVIRMTLRKGCRGAEVKELQTALILKGYDPGTADGVFGSKTEEAVKDFQRDNGLTADGIVGEKTWAVLLEGTSPDIPLPDDENPQDEPVLTDYVDCLREQAVKLSEISARLLDVCATLENGVG